MLYVFGGIYGVGSFGREDAEALPDCRRVRD